MKSLSKMYEDQLICLSTIFAINSHYIWHKMPFEKYLFKNMIRSLTFKMAGFLKSAGVDKSLKYCI